VSTERLIMTDSSSADPGEMKMLKDPLFKIPREEAGCLWFGMYRLPATDAAGKVGRC
jgi:hypothetical protein